MTTNLWGALYLALGLIVALIWRFDPSGDGLNADADYGDEPRPPLWFVLTPGFLMVAITVVWPPCLAFWLWLHFWPREKPFPLDGWPDDKP